MGKIISPYDKRLVGKGMGTHGDSKVIGVKFPPDVEKVLQEMGSAKADYIRKLVSEDLKAKGLI